MKKPLYREKEMTLWSGRFREKIKGEALEFTSSIEVDKKLYHWDIEGSIGYAKTLLKAGILKEKEAEKIIQGLKEIEKDIEEGKLSFQGKEDIHMAIEEELIRRIGEPGEKLHTGRSRNEQIVLDERLYLKEEIKNLLGLIKNLQGEILNLAEKNLELVMPGYTHLQYAEPVLFSHYILSYFWMFERDRERFENCLFRVDVLPLGVGALAGCSFSLDREYLAKILGFSRVSENSIDTVSDRDYILETLFCLSLLMIHLSRLAEELVLFSSPGFDFLEIGDAFSTGSSLIPHKKNPDIPELVRGKVGSVLGWLLSLFVTLKALPLSYNRDMQEDKKPLFEALETTKRSLKIFTLLLPNLRLKKEKLKEEAEKGYWGSTQLVDWLVEKGLPFRKAYHLVGEMVKYCAEKKKTLRDLTQEEYLRFSPLFEASVWERLSLEKALDKKTSGSTHKERVREQLEKAKSTLQNG